MPTTPLRLIFMGTAGFAVPSLRALAASRHPVLAVYTQPARPAGRGLKERPSPVAAAAQELGLEIRTPASLKNEAAQSEFAAHGADLAVVGAYGLILPPPILNAPRLGCVNLHASLLPRWRGAAPIQRALLAGDPATGITIFQMEPSLDTGPIFAMERIALDAGSTATSVHDRLAELAAAMITPLLDDLATSIAKTVPQPEDGVTYASKIDKAEGRIDWAQPADLIERQLRALNPWPGCWTELGEQRLRILAADVTSGEGAPGKILDAELTVACGEGALRLTELQRAGGKPLSAEAFLHGFSLPVGTRLGATCPATS